MAKTATAPDATRATTAATSAPTSRGRRLDHGSDVAEGRTTATLTVLIISMWTLLVLARPLTGWKLVLVASLALAVAVIVAVPTLGHGIFLLLVLLATKDPTTST